MSWAEDAYDRELATRRTLASGHIHIRAMIQEIEDAGESIPMSSDAARWCPEYGWRSPYTPLKALIPY
jgi:hypothetical protein